MENSLKYPTDGKPDTRSDLLAAPLPDHCFLRWPGRPGVDYDPNYVANGREAIAVFSEFIRTTRQIDGDSLIDACAEMHRVFSAGSSGTHYYKRLDQAEPGGNPNLGIPADWPAGTFRPEIQASSSRPEIDFYANYVNRAVLNNRAPLEPGPIEIEGIPENAWPSNQDFYNREQRRQARFHVYPSVSFLRLYFDKAAPLLEAARGPHEEPEEALAAIADYYYVMVNARPYAVLNNGLFMAQVNLLLRLNGFPAVCHGELDHLAHRFQLKDFHVLFGKHVAEGLPREPELATCQCIISHPSSAKFMAIKHKGGYLPPTVKIPYGFDLPDNINYVLEGIERKYGLKTFALRQLVWLPEYQCIEVEILGKDARQLAAVWVGQEEYQQIRGTDGESQDAFGHWLESKINESVPPQRPPWERAGWFREAAHWIDQQLDRLTIRRNGPLLQHGAFRSEALVLRMPTSSGSLFFKAAAQIHPNEVALTRLLAAHWPGYVTELVAFDQDRNWMLMPDYDANRQDSGTPEDYAAAVSALATIQFGSTALVDQLKALGCEFLGAGRLKDFLLGLEQLDDFYGVIAAGLTEAERQELAAVAPQLADLCDQLSEFNIPATLIHPDFCASNFFIHSGSARIIDWANCSIGDPFFSLMKLLRNNHARAFESPESDPVIRNYLQVFYPAETESRLLEALTIVSQLQHAWRLLRWSRQVGRHEPQSPAMARLRRHVPLVAKELLMAHRRGD